MKKFSMIGGYLLFFLLVCVGITCMCSCDHFKGHSAEPDALNDTTLMAQQVNDYFNPTFTDVESVVEFQNEILHDQKVDSFIGTINPEKLRNVASVLFEKKEKVTLLTLYDEYQRNKSVYDNLPARQIVQQTETKPTVTEEQQDRVEESSKSTVKSISYRDTTIDGKKCKVETKISQYE